MTVSRYLTTFFNSPDPHDRTRAVSVSARPTESGLIFVAVTEARRTPHDVWPGAHEEVSIVGSWDAVVEFARSRGCPHLEGSKAVA